MKRGKADKPELHGFEALLQRLIAHDHVRITRMKSEHGERVIAKVLFDESAHKQICDVPEYVYMTTHFARTSPNFAQVQNYGKFIFSIPFEELKHDMPFHPRDASFDTPVKRGERLAALLEAAPEINGRGGAADQKGWVDTTGHDDGRGTRTRRGSHR